MLNDLDGFQGHYAAEIRIQFQQVTCYICIIFLIYKIIEMEKTLIVRSQRRQWSWYDFLTL